MPPNTAPFFGPSKIEPIITGIWIIVALVNPSGIYPKNGVNAMIIISAANSATCTMPSVCDFLSPFALLFITSSLLSFPYGIQYISPQFTHTYIVAKIHACMIIFVAMYGWRECLLGHSVNRNGVTVSVYHSLPFNDNYVSKNKHKITYTFLKYVLE